MKTIELLAQTVNIVNELMEEDNLEFRDCDKQQWLDMSEAKLEQEGYSIIPFTSRWAKDT